MFTQRDEEKYILEFFNVYVGRFLDIGAYDGECFSTTRALALKGWSGVCVEPSPSVFPALQKRYGADPLIETLDVAIANTTGEIDFYDSGGDMISTVDTDHVKLWEDKAGCKFKKIKVKSLTVLDLFEKVGCAFDFISLDVEGTNLNILQQFPFEKLQQTKMICVEFDRQPNIVINLVKPFGFKLLHQTAENLLLVR